jgi:peptidoglycan/LPS O-acetylase OafA/YrhL
LSRPARTVLPWVQALRALAALLVAFAHFAHDAIGNGADPRGWLKAATQFLPFDAGVDIFFVISGFVIVYASAALFGQRAGPGIFLRRRLTRIVPLYWIMTTAFVAVLLLGRATIHGDIGGPAYIAASYAFIPWPRPDGVMQPALGLGWTLNYEMFFYIIFTPFLLLPRRPAVIAAVALLCLLALMGHFGGFANAQLDYWANPIILEFCAGMAIALALASGVAFSTLSRILLGCFAIAALHLCVTTTPAFRPFAWGLPAALLVCAAAFGPAAAESSGITALLVRLGDASYAMYLVHPFVMRFFSILWHRFHAANELAGTIYVAAGLAAAQICALLINAGIEPKLKIWLRRRSGKIVNEAV